MAFAAFGPGLGQRTPKLSQKAALALLEDQHGLEIPLTRRIQKLESLEIGDYDFAREAFPVWHHGLSSYPALYWLDSPLANFH